MEFMNKLYNEPQSHLYHGFNISHQGVMLRWLQANIGQMRPIAEGGVRLDCLPNFTTSVHQRSCGTHSPKKHAFPPTTGRPTEPPPAQFDDEDEDDGPSADMKALLRHMSDKPADRALQAEATVYATLERLIWCMGKIDRNNRGSGREDELLPHVKALQQAYAYGNGDSTLSRDGNRSSIHSWLQLSADDLYEPIGRGDNVSIEEFIKKWVQRGGWLLPACELPVEFLDYYDEYCQADYQEKCEEGEEIEGDFRHVDEDEGSDE